MNFSSVSLARHSTLPAVLLLGATVCAPSSAFSADLSWFDEALEPYAADWQNDGIRRYLTTSVYASCPALPEEGGGWRQVQLLRAWHYAQYDYFATGLKTEFELRSGYYWSAPQPLKQVAIADPNEQIKRFRAGPTKWIGRETIIDPFDDRVLWEWRVGFTVYEDVEGFGPRIGSSLKPTDWSTAKQQLAYALWADPNRQSHFLARYVTKIYWPRERATENSPIGSIVVAPVQSWELPEFLWNHLAPEHTISRDKAPYPGIRPQKPESPLCVQFQAERIRHALGQSTEEDQVLHRALHAAGAPMFGDYWTYDEAMAHD